ncbi:hypothetical protein ASPWEDRAFT_177174 [Aspergillus wentii DTO 134E9]|uniref:Uncharacterized protein n=1 Tax=Aspergillus wentii DTO 134E9 TaxID=1073089 RepID=A0A1L9R6H3_ASPWE|nr:uncharacterized protein ASPWEDRAFT_177174 [Aspergillus wentii DTO 134E9]OJJ30521.1 hypothetical protein ASPWEDRAFT_177174 [Aspergillus wentii DTO 134E9]
MQSTDQLDGCSYQADQPHELPQPPSSSAGSQRDPSHNPPRCVPDGGSLSKPGAPKTQMQIPIRDPKPQPTTYDVIRKHDTPNPPKKPIPETKLPPPIAVSHVPKRGPQAAPTCEHCKKRNPVTVMQTLASIQKHCSRTTNPLP